MGEGREKYEAFVTLATNDTYALGCLVVGNSLRKVGTTRQLAVMVTQGVSPSVRNQLSGVFDHTFLVNALDSNDATNLELLGRPDLSVTFTKFHCWRLTQFKKCVFMDADTLVVQNIDELFDREELSAAPDPGWPDCFNSGVFVYVPSEETYRNLLSFAVTSQSFDGGDQGLLNLFFKGWATEDIGKHLPFIYNVVSQAFYSYLPAFKQFRDTIKVVHFIGPVKPWHHTYNASTRTVRELPDTGHSLDFLQLWWDIFMDNVQPNLDPELGGIVGELAHINLQGDSVDKDDRVRKLQWEQGHADYMGVDRFENIKARLDEKIAEPTPSASKSSVDKEEDSKAEVRSSTGALHAGVISPEAVGAVSEASAPSGKVDSEHSLLSQVEILRAPESGADVVESVAVEASHASAGEHQQSKSVDLPSVEETQVLLLLPTLVSPKKAASPSLPSTAHIPHAVGQDTAETFTVSAPPTVPIEDSQSVSAQVQTPTQPAAVVPVVASPGQTSQPFIASPTSDSPSTVGKSVVASPSSASARTIGKSVVTAGSPSPATASAVGKQGVTSSPSSAAAATSIGKPGVTSSSGPITTSAVGKPGVTSPSPAATTAVGKPGVTSPSPSSVTTATSIGKPGVASPSPSPATTTAIGKSGVASPSPSPATTTAIGKSGVASPSPSPATTTAIGKSGVSSSSPDPTTAVKTIGKPGVVSSSPSPATISTAASKPENQQTAQSASVTEAKTQPKVSESGLTDLSPTPEPNPVPATDQSPPSAEGLPSKSSSSRPESLTTKPVSRSGADSSKSSFVSGLASKFAKPSPTSPVAAASKPTSPFSQLSSKFDAPGAAKTQAFGAPARSSGGTAASQKAAEGASQSGPTPKSSSTKKE